MIAVLTDLWWGGVAWTVQITVIVLFALLVSRVIRHREARVKVIGWRAVYLMIAAVPFVSTLMPRPAAIEVLPDPAHWTGQIELVAIEQPIPLVTVFLGIWVIGSLVASRSILREAWAVRRVMRSSYDLADPDLQLQLDELCGDGGIRGTINIRQSDLIATPLVCGVLRPTMLWPGSWRERQAGEVRAAMRHELAHLRSRDTFWLLMTQVIGSVFWFHPLVLVANRRHALRVEQAADDAVIGAGESAPEYAQLVLHAAAASRGAKAMPRLAMAHASTIEQRLLAILDPDQLRGGVTRLVYGSVLLIAVTSVYAATFLQPAVGAPRQVVRHVETDPAPATVLPAPPAVTRIPRDAPYQLRPNSGHGLEAGLRDVIRQAAHLIERENQPNELKSGRDFIVFYTNRKGERVEVPIKAIPFYPVAEEAKPAEPPVP